MVCSSPAVASGHRVKHLVVDETTILLAPPPPLAGVSIAIERARQQSDSTLADGQASGHSPGGGAELAGVIRRHLATGETVILLYPPLHLVGVSIAMEIKRQQNDSLAND